MEGNDQLLKENPAPLLPGPFRPEGMPKAKDFVALCSARRHAGQETPHASSPKMRSSARQDIFHVWRTREKIPSMDQDEAATISMLVCGNSFKGWAFLLIQHEPRTRPFGICDMGFFFVGSWSRAKARLGSTLEERLEHLFDLNPSNSRSILDFPYFILSELRHS